MGANESLGVTPRLREVDPALIWGMACTDSNAIKVDFSHNNARQCQFPNDWIFEADTNPLIDKQSGFVLLFSKARAIKTTAQYGNDTVKLTADIQKHMHPYVDADTGRLSGFTQFSVLWGDHIFNVTGVSGIVYLWWANKISSYQRDPATGLVSPHIHKMHMGMPLLVHTDSHFQILHVCPLIVHENHVRFISKERFKFPHKLTAWTPGFPHDTKPIHHSPRTLILSEVDVAARRDREILPEGERRSFGVRHKVDRSRSKKYDNSSYNEEDDDEDDEDEGRGEISEATLIEELDPLSSSNNRESDPVLADNVAGFFERALNDDVEDEDDEDATATKDREEKTMGNDLEWDDDLLVKQQVTRMTIHSQIENDNQRVQRRRQLREDERRSHAKVASSDKGKEEEGDAVVEYEEGGQDLKFVGKTFESERMFKSAVPDDSTSSLPQSLTSAQHGIASHEGGRTNKTYAPILRRQPGLTK